VPEGLGFLSGRWLGPFLKIWWLVLISRSRSAAVTGLGNGGYQSQHVLRRDHAGGVLHEYQQVA
jgi:hypothetical protein